MTVVAPGGGRTSTRVPADVPVARLAPGLGAVVNVANVSDLDDDSGARIPPAATLAEAGMNDGSTVHVVAPGITRPEARPEARREAGRPDPADPGRPGPADPGRPDPADPARRRAAVPLPAAVLAVVIAAVAFFVLGGVVLGSSVTSPGPGPVARRAATAWLAARPFPGPLAPGVPARLGRDGAIAASSVQGAGQWHHGNEAGETFVVVPTAPAGTAPTAPFAVTVVTRVGKLEFPPTVSPIPVVNGRMLPAPGGSSVTNGGPLPATLSAWARDQFGPTGVQPAVLQLGLAGNPTVVASWSPEAGGTVYRLKVSLDSLAPGTVAAKAIGDDKALAAKVTADTATVQADQAALTQAQAQLQAAQQTAATAVPPGPPPPATAVIAGGQKLTADTATLAADRDAAGRAAPLAHGVTRRAVVATYDVWMRAQAVVGWAPAAYGVTG